MKSSSKCTASQRIKDSDPIDLLILLPITVNHEGNTQSSEEEVVKIQQLIELRTDVHDFLVALKSSGRDVVLVTNDQPDSLSLKIESTALGKYFDALYSTHEFGVTKGCR